MSTSQLYKVKELEKKVELIHETEFSIEGFKERYDIQEWIADNPNILGEELFIIAKEFNEFDKTRERTDLLALDREGNLVIIELKRDDTGADVHWQAIKYASYFRKVNPDQIVKINAKDRTVDEETSALQIKEFTGCDDDLSQINQKQRIILGSHRFAKEVTSAILWLYDYGIDIKCVEISPFFDSETKTYYLVVSTVLPVAGTESFEICANIGEKQIMLSGGGPRRKEDAETQFLSSIALNAIEQLPEKVSKPNKRSRWAGTWNQLRYYKIWFNSAPWENHDFSYQLHLLPHSSDKRLNLKFFFRITSAKANGLTEKQIEVLATALKDYAAQNGFIYESGDDFYQIDTYFDKSIMDKNHRAISSLSLLMTAITPLVESFNQEEMSV